LTNRKAQYSFFNFTQFINLKYRGFVAYTFFLVVLLTLFESAQQYYYILQFDLVAKDQLSITDLTIGHSYRWIVWLLTTLLYFGMMIYKGQSNRIYNLTKVWPSIQHLVLLITINVLIISLIQLALSDRPFTLENIWDNCIFFFFQKAPIYTLAYGSMLGLFHLIDSNQNLAIEILNLKKQNQSPQTDDLEALSIKIGNKNKIISFKDILWIEAYDYCVKIHTVDEHSYAMRNSLKALEKKLLNHQFLRVHRRAIVNMNKVMEVTYNASSFLTLTDQSRIDIAQSRVRDLKGFLQPDS